MSRLLPITASQELADYQARADRQWNESMHNGRHVNVDKLLNLTNQLSLFHFHKMRQTDEAFVKGYEDEHLLLIQQSQDLQKKRVVCCLSVVAGVANVVGGIVGLKAGISCAAAGATKAALQLMKAESAVSTGITSIGQGLQAIQKPIEDHTQRKLSLNNSQTELVKSKAEQSRGNKRKHDELVYAHRQSIDKADANKAEAFRTMAGG